MILGKLNEIGKLKRKIYCLIWFRNMVRTVGPKLLEKSKKEQLNNVKRNGCLNLNMKAIATNGVYRINEFFLKKYKYSKADGVKYKNICQNDLRTVLRIFSTHLYDRYKKHLL